MNADFRKGDVCSLEVAVTEAPDGYAVCAKTKGGTTFGFTPSDLTLLRRAPVDLATCELPVEVCDEFGDIWTMKGREGSEAWVRHDRTNLYESVSIHTLRPLDAPAPAPAPGQSDVATEIERLHIAHAAFKPFAEFAEALSDKAPDDTAMGLMIDGGIHYGPGCPTIGDCRKAREALASTAPACAEKGRLNGRSFGHDPIEALADIPVGVPACAEKEYLNNRVGQLEGVLSTVLDHADAEYGPNPLFDRARKALACDGKVELDELPFRRRDIQRGLVLFRTSSNAHGSVNFVSLTSKVDALPQSAKDELSCLMRYMADGLSPVCPPGHILINGSAVPEEFMKVAWAAKEFLDDWKKGDFSLSTLAALDAQSLSDAMTKLSDVITPGALSTKREG